MAFTYSIHPEYNLLWNRLCGVVTHEDVTGLTRAFRGDPGFRTDMWVLNDLRMMQHDETGFRNMASTGMDIKAFRQDQTTPIRLAFVAPSPLAYGMARMFQSVMSGFTPIDVGLFKTIETAADFLDLPRAARVLVADPSCP